MNDDNKKLLKLLAASIMAGAGGNAAFRSLIPSKPVFNPKKDLYTPGGSPVYVDMSQDEANRFEQLTGTKSASVNTKIAGDDYSWLTKALVGGGGAYAGWSILDKVLDNIRKRKLDGELSQAQGDLASLYATKPIKGVGKFPENKKIGSLQNYMDGSYEFWKAARYEPTFMQGMKEAGILPAMSAAAVAVSKSDNDPTEEDFAKAKIVDPSLKKLIIKAHRIRKGKKPNTTEAKTAGVLDSIGSIAASPITGPVKSLAGYGVKSVAPILAAIALISAYSSYKNHSGTAGDRRNIKAVRNEARNAEDRPYVELKPRVVAE